MAEAADTASDPSALCKSFRDLFSLAVLLPSTESQNSISMSPSGTSVLTDLLINP